MEELIDHLMWFIEHDQWGRERTVALCELCWLAQTRLRFSGDKPDSERALFKRYVRLAEIIRIRDAVGGWIEPEEH